jgi:hypothetical protein
MRHESAYRGTCPVDGSCGDVGNGRCAADAKPGTAIANAVFNLCGRPISQRELIGVSGSTG